MSGAIGVLAGTVNSAVLLASESPELPKIDEFLPPEILFQGTPFAMNRIILVRVLMACLLYTSPSPRD